MSTTPATGSAFPAALDALPGVPSNAREDDEGLEHDVVHDRANAAINAVQSEIGAGSDPDAGTLRGRLNSLESMKRIGCTFSRAGDDVEGGAQCEVPVDFAGEILGWTLLSDAAGSIVIDVWRDSYANYPPTSADRITASAKPSLTDENKANDESLAGWTKSFSAGDVFKFNVESCDGISRATLILHVRVSP